MSDRDFLSNGAVAEVALPVSSFASELSDLINRHGGESRSDTPDYILAEYLCRCLDNFAETMDDRDIWWRKDSAKAPDFPRFTESETGG